MQLRHAANTDTGRTRDHNEDTFAIEAGPERAEHGALFVVCDGMGGFAAGEVASELAASTIRAQYYAAADLDPARALRTAFVDANARIFSRGHGKMGTTGVAALLLDHIVLLANVGDSRAYLLRGDEICQVTRDHSFVAEQVSAGVLPADQARESSYRNIITRALGLRPEVEVDLYQETVAPGDRVLLCSDGLHGQLEPEEMAKIAGSGPLQRAVDGLIGMANERGGPDNITAVLIEVVATDGDQDVVVPARAGRRAVADPLGSTARLPVTSAVEREGPGGHVHRPAQVHQAVMPPLAAPRPRRGPILGLIFITLIGLALLGGVVWFVLTGGLGDLAPVAAPSVPSLTPVRSTANTNTVGGPTQTPTFVPTARPQPTPRP
jgi:serine/threonine protein phosphatase PrpC